MPRKSPLALILLGGLMLAGLLIWQILVAGQASSVPVIINGTAVPSLPTLDGNAVSQGAALYQQSCAVCHGLELQGAPNWKTPLPDGSFPPPPHDDSGHTWHHPDFLLLQIMTDGGKKVYDGTMPAFGEQLTPDELRAILEFLKSNWNTDAREFQWWITNTYPTPTPGPDA